MNGDSALGLLEVYGLTAAVAVADQMVKAAPVELLPRLEIGDGLVTVVARGDVSSVQEAIAVGRSTATAYQSLRSASVLGRPAPGVAELFFATSPTVDRAPSVRRNRAARPAGAQSRKRGGTSGV